MLLKMILILEILSMLGCIHCIYGRKIELDINAIVLFLVLLIILEAANYFPLGNLLSLIIYIPIFAYCKRVFKETIAQTFINLVLFTVILTAIEFSCMLVIKIVIPEKIVMRNLVGNVIILGICIWGLPLLKIDRLKGLYKRGRLVKALLGFIFIIILILLLQGKLWGKVATEFFVFSIPVILILLFILGKWNVAQNTVEYMEKERDTANQMQKEYENLILSVRLRQHEFKNHIAAIFSTHYTYKTYEKLVQAQDEYCNKLIQENKYNNLLQLGNSVLVGFLYGKFQELEDDGITIEYEINVQVKKYSVPVYYLIEMWGILLDNAVEAVKDIYEKKIINISVTEAESKYVFSIRNRSVYRTYEEIESWFQMGISSKGLDRGLGLYHVRCLSQEWNCSICCRNIEIDKNNWIEFILEIGKADSD